jgi:hypothetical protein
MLNTTIPFETVLSNIFIYLSISFVAIFILGKYAKIRLKERPIAYNMLRLTRQAAFLICLVGTVIIIGTKFIGVEYTQKSLSYLSLPYFVAIAFYAVNVFRRIKAERERRL